MLEIDLKKRIPLFFTIVIHYDTWFNVHNLFFFYHVIGANDFKSTFLIVCAMYSHVFGIGAGT